MKLDKDLQEMLDYEDRKIFTILNSSSGKCSHFPCHDKMDDCRFCFCPLYPCAKKYRGGKMIINKSGQEIWDCSSCNRLHRKRTVERYIKYVNRKI